MFRLFMRRQPPQAGLFDLLIALFTLSFFPHPTLVSAQFLVNGQIFTNALAIVDAPAPNSTFHAGANMPIAIDVSGDGKLQTAAQAPNSGLDTSFDSLELYLTSASQKMNLTIMSNGSGFLQQEPGSTVKHLDFQLSNCIPEGEYNFTIYEASHINGTACYTITSYPVAIQNTKFNGTCESGTNALQSLPQNSSPPSSNPLLDTSTLTPLNVNFVNAGTPGKTVTTSLAEGTTVTLTLGPSGTSGISPTGSPYPSSGMKTKTREPPATVTEVVTIVLVGFETIVTTLPGQTIPFTQVVTSLETQTITATPTPVNNAQGFTPLNSAPGPLLPAPLLVLSTLLVWFVVFLSLLGPYQFLAAG